jgi:hypothetical protein
VTGAQGIDFLHQPDLGEAPELAAAKVHALLTDPVVSSDRSSRTFEVSHSLLGRLDLTHHRLPPPPMDRLIVTVSHPIVADDVGEFVSGVLFRQAHDVIPSPVDEGIAYFGSEWVEENIVGHDPPPTDARAELAFSPPRAHAPYLLEFWCGGESEVRCTGTDGSENRSTGPINVVLFSGTTDITYTLDSDQYWWFRRCAIRWLSE